MWLGDADFADAPFSVTAAGALKATSGDFSGTLKSGATIESNTVSVGSTDADKIKMGEGTVWEGYDMVLLVEDGGDADAAAIVGLGKKIGIAGAVSYTHLTLPTTHYV